MAQIIMQTQDVNIVEGTDYYVFIDNSGSLSSIRYSYTGKVYSSGDIWAYTTQQECEDKYEELGGIIDV